MPRHRAEPAASFEPDLSTLGASAPLDYVVESVFDPNAKIKEGFHAFAYSMKDGTQFTGIPTRETATEQFIRPGLGPRCHCPHQSQHRQTRSRRQPHAPVGLADPLSFVDKRCLFAFLSQLGRPGPFDASKANVSPASGASTPEPRPPTPNTPIKSINNRPSTPSSTAPPAAGAIHHRLARRVEYSRRRHRRHRAISAAPPPAKRAFDLHRRRQGLALTANLSLRRLREPNPTPDLTAGPHTLAVQFDPKALPDNLPRVEAQGATFLGN